jgi:hypothetical protein
MHSRSPTKGCTPENSTLRKGEAEGSIVPHCLETMRLCLKKKKKPNQTKPNQTKKQARGAGGWKKGVAHICNPSYLGGEIRRIKVRSQHCFSKIQGGWGRQKPVI